MVVCLVIRGANGLVVWQKVYTSTQSYVWRCDRDQFTVTQPTPATLESTLVAIGSHSQQLVGSIAQVVELTL